MRARGLAPGLRLRVATRRAPDPFLLPPAIAAALAGRPFPAGPEAEVAASVARAVRAERARREEQRC